MARRHISSIILVLFWDYLLYSHDLFIRYFGFATVYPYLGPSTYAPLIVSYVGFLSFPILGLLGDVWIGRYKAVLIGTIFCFTSWIIGGIGFVIYSYHSSKVLLWIVYIFGLVFQVAGFSSFRVNIVQYNVDQFIGASSDELHVIICYHSAAVPVTNMICQLTYCLFDSEVYNVMINFIVSGLAVALALVSHSLFKHKLENISLIKNPIKLIVGVLCYARKHKYPENRSALTYWEEDAPSRLDLGKEKYGGPFTEEEVEDVKTFFRMLPLFIGLVGFACSDEHAFHTYLNQSLLLCVISKKLAYFASTVFLFIAYLLFIRACFHKYIPSMLSRMVAGLVLALVVLISYLIMFNFSTDTSKFMLIPQITLGASYVLMISASLEFTIAQSPVHMRGVMVGMWFASLGVGYLISFVTALLFHCQDDSSCTSFYYYLTKSVLVSIILIAFGILAKRYKYRVRDNEINIFQIVDDHYDRYMKQEDDYINSI